MRWGMWELLVIGLLTMAVGCCRQVYVPVEHHTTDTLRAIKERIDSIVERDSVYVEVRGDTLLREVWRWRTSTKLRTDTIYRTRTDTVPVVVPVERKPKVGVKTQIASGILWTVRGCIILFIVIWLIRRFISKR